MQEVLYSANIFEFFFTYAMIILAHMFVLKGFLAFTMLISCSNTRMVSYVVDLKLVPYIGNMF
jgi:hypothetical protein